MPDKSELIRRIAAHDYRPSLLPIGESARYRGSHEVEARGRVEHPQADLRPEKIALAHAS